jgi:hypothetical protein
VTHQYKNISEKTISERRTFLKMGAAGLPMVLTLRASAAGAVISQLKCAATLQTRQRILVADDGSCWVGSSNVNISRNNSIVKFKKNAEFVFPAGSAPSNYWPTGDDDYALYKYGAGYEVNPDRHLNSSLQWDYRNNKEGLYVALSVQYAEAYGNSGGWPGVSCLVSILAFIDTQ